MSPQDSRPEPTPDKFVGGPEDFGFNPPAPEDLTPPEDEVSAYELRVFMREATLGLKPDQSSIQPMTPKRRIAFARMMRSVARIKAKGGIVDIPDDIGALPDDPKAETGEEVSK